MLAPDMVHGSNSRAEDGPWPDLPPWMDRQYGAGVLNARTEEEQETVVLIQELSQTPRFFQGSRVLGKRPIALMPASSLLPNNSIGPVQAPTLHCVLGGYKALGLNKEVMMRECNKHFWGSIAAHYSRSDVLTRLDLGHMDKPTEIGDHISKFLQASLVAVLNKVRERNPVPPPPNKRKSGTDSKPSASSAQQKKVRRETGETNVVTVARVANKRLVVSAVVPEGLPADTTARMGVVSAGAAKVAAGAAGADTNPERKQQAWDKEMDEDTTEQQDEEDVKGGAHFRDGYQGPGTMAYVFKYEEIEGESKTVTYVNTHGKELKVTMPAGAAAPAVAEVAAGAAEATANHKRKRVDGDGYQGGAQV